jgi:hypothetical protein
MPIASLSGWSGKTGEKSVLFVNRREMKANLEGKDCLGSWRTINDRFVDEVSPLADCVSTTRPFLGRYLALGEKQKIPPVTDGVCTASLRYPLATTAFRTGLRMSVDAPQLDRNTSDGVSCHWTEYGIRQP